MPFTRKRPAFYPCLTQNYVFMELQQDLGYWRYSPTFGKTKKTKVPHDASVVVSKTIRLEVDFTSYPSAFISTNVLRLILPLCESGAENHTLLILIIASSAQSVRHCGQSKHSRGLFFHFLFVTSVQGFLAITTAGGGKNQYLQCNVWPVE